MFRLLNFLSSTRKEEAKEYGTTFTPLSKSGIKHHSNPHIETTVLCDYVQRNEKFHEFERVYRDCIKKDKNQDQDNTIYRMMHQALDA